MQEIEEIPSCSSSTVNVEEEEDKFDCVPDEMIHVILSSFVDTKDAIFHCVCISKRWRELCRSLPYLKFDRRSFPEDEELRDEVFINSVDMVLAHRGNSDILRFELEWFNSSEDDIVMRNTNRWINEALGHHVRDLSISTGQHHQFTYEFPDQLVNSRYLRRFSIDFYCNMGYVNIVLPEVTMNLPVLEHLSLGGLSFANDSLTRRFLSSCPLITALELHDCDMRTDNRRNLTVDGPNLKHFEFVYLFPRVLLLNNTMARVVRLCAQNLEKLTCESFFGQVFCLENNTMLSDVSLEMVSEHEDDPDYEGLSKIPTDIKEVYARRVMQFLQAVHQVKRMELSSGMLEVLSRAPDMPDLQPSSLCNLQCLKIEMAFTQSSMRALAFLLNIAPIVDSVFLISKELNPEDVGDDQWEPEMLLAGMLSHLKFVQIQGMEGCDNELKVLEFVFRKATILKKVHLVFCSFIDISDIEKFEDEVRGLPRASSSVQITKEQEKEEEIEEV